MAIPNKADVFVVGGGPAGLSAAIAARLRGFDVTVADAAQPPIDKACGEGLMPDSLDALRRLGVAVDAGACFAFHGIRFIGAGGRVAANFRRGHGIAMQRMRLHQLLIDRAQEVGVHFEWRTRLAGLDGIAARWIIGADGANSFVRRWASLDAAQSESFRYGFRRHYRVPAWTDLVEVYWADQCQMYVTPVGNDEACVALITRDPRVRLTDAMPLFPELLRRLEGAPAVDRERGAVSAMRRLKNIYRGNVVLIGDASGSVDAITGEGLSLAFRQALLLADALATGDLKRYQTAHRRMARRPAFMAQLMLLLDRFPRLRPRVLRTLAAEPAIFERLLAVHAGV